MRTNLALSCLLIGCFAVIPADATPIPQASLQRQQRIEADSAERTPAQKKLSLELLYSIRVAAGKPPVEGVADITRFQAADAESMLGVTIKGTITPELLDFIAKQGAKKIAASPRYLRVSAFIAADKIEAIAARSEVTYIKIAPRPIHGASSGATVPGLQDPEGDLAHAAAAARAAFNTTGTGVKVCVISDDVLHLADAMANGSLGAVDVMDGEDGLHLRDPPSGEGTAMLEIVHRLAPDAALGFATAGDFEQDMADNVSALATVGKCNVIVDDIDFPSEGPFQETVLAGAVRAAANSGVLYVSAAGNDGNKRGGEAGTWEGDFVATTPNKDNTIVKDGQTYLLTPLNANGDLWSIVTDTTNIEGKHKFAYLYWNDVLPESTHPVVQARTDYRIFTKVGDTVDASEANLEGGDGDARIEIAKGTWIAIGKNQSSSNRYLRVATGGGHLSISTSGATSGHETSDAANVIGVAELDVRDQPAPFVGGGSITVDEDSSDGLRLMFYNPDGSLMGSGLDSDGGFARNKPDLTAANCVTTDVPGFTPFCGTSAAAPHVAAFGALIMSAFPNLTPTQVRAAMVGSALDIDLPGWDLNSGFGIVMPGPALTAAKALSAVNAAKMIAVNSFGANNPCVLGGPPAPVVVCWGKPYGATQISATPSLVANLPDNITQVSNGGMGSCALTWTGEVWCWGSNSSAQLGQPPTISVDGPTQIAGLPGDIAEIAAGGTTNCARTIEGDVYCWGNNGFGQIRADNPIPYSATPAKIFGLPPGATRIAGGFQHFCAAYGGGTPSAVWCWGDNGEGQGGSSQVSTPINPTQVAGLPTSSMNPPDISAGSHHTCANFDGIGLWCWGSNYSGQLGNGKVVTCGVVNGNNQFNCSYTPLAPSGLTGVTWVSAGNSHTCAVAGAQLWCWGANDSGQLGNNSTLPSLVPVLVAGSADVPGMVAASSNYSCAWYSNAKKMKCWGANGSGQLGNATVEQSSVPVEVGIGAAAGATNH